MDLLLLGGVAAAGLYVNKDNETVDKAKERIESHKRNFYKTDISQPSGANIYESNRSKEVQVMEQKIGDTVFKRASAPMQTGIVPQFYNQIASDSVKRKRVRDYIKEQEQVRGSLTTFDKQKKLINEHRNAIMLANDSLTSDYRSELLEKKSENPFVAIQKEQDLPGGWNKPITPDGFKRGHYNMVPFFGGNVKQNMNFSIYNRHKLETFTGKFDYFWKPKREVRIWNPLEDPQNMFGLQSTSNFMQSRIVEPLTKDGVKPFEQVRVPPGLNMGYNTVGQIGHHSLYRVLPKTIDETRIDKQISYTLPNIPQDFITEERATLPVVAKNRVETFKENYVENLLPTDGPAIPPAARGKYYIPETKKDGTLHSYLKPASAVYEAPKHHNLKYSVVHRVSHKGISNDRHAAPEQEKTYNNRKSYANYPNERSHTAERVPITNLEGVWQKGVAYDPSDVARTTKKEQTLASKTGNMEYYEKGVAYDPSDVARTTRKEQTLASKTGNMEYYEKGVAYDPSDVARSTRKEQTLMSHNGNMEYYEKGVAYDPSDVARSTRKEQTLMSHNGNMEYYEKGVAYDPSDVARSTRKEQTLASYNGNLGYYDKSVAYDPVTYKPRTTRKEQTLATKNGNVGYYEKSIAYDPSDLARTTRKEQTLATKNGNIGYYEKSVAYDPADVARTTRKEQTLAERTGNLERQYGDAYQVNHGNTKAKHTERETTNRDWSSHPATVYAENQRSYEDIRNMEVNVTKEIVAQGRTPNVGPSISAGHIPAGAESVNLTTGRNQYRNFNTDYGVTSYQGDLPGQRPNIRLRDPLLQIDNVRLEGKMLADVRF